MTPALILVRHAAPTIDQTTPPPEWPLSHEGRAAAAALAARIAPFEPAAAVVSPEPKAWETGEIIARRLEIPFTVDAGFTEHRRPGMPFMNRDEFETWMRGFFTQPERRVLQARQGHEGHWKGRKPEGRVQTLARFEAALTRHEARPLVVVTHGTILSLYLAPRLACDGFELWSSLRLPEAFVLDEAARLIDRLA